MDESASATLAEMDRRPFRKGRGRRASECRFAGVQDPGDRLFRSMPRGRRTGLIGSLEAMARATFTCPPSLIRGMALTGRSVIPGDLRGCNLNVRMRLDQACDIFVRFALGAERFHLIADHTDEGLNRKHLRAQTSSFSKRLLCSKCLFNGVGFHDGFSNQTIFVLPNECS